MRNPESLQATENIESKNTLDAGSTPAASMPHHQLNQKLRHDLGTQSVPHSCQSKKQGGNMSEAALS